MNILYPVIAVATLSSALATAADPTPNVIYILADDLGYGDISSYNDGGKFLTPAIDSLAVKGVRFTDMHTSSSVSTPSRYSILTGRYNWRTRLQDGVLWSYDTPLIDKERETVASLMHENGYRTGVVGKWHLGLGWVKDASGEIDHNATLTECPNHNGFDYSYVMSASLDIPPYIYFENGTPTAPVGGKTDGNSGLGFWREGYIADDFDIHETLYHFTEKAIDFISKEDEKPFFLYLPLTAPHSPILPNGRFAGATITSYGDFVLMVDEVVRRVVAAVERAGLTENTMIIFTSDNGFAPAANLESQLSNGHNPSGDLRGHKADIYEGGHRVPFIVKAPFITKRVDVEIDAPMSQVGLFATMAEMLGKQIKDGSAPDSYSYFGAIERGKVSKKEALRPIVIHSNNGYFAIREGDWKLNLTPGSGGWSYPRPNEEMAGSPKMQLFNLTDNISEDSSKNLYESNPEIADRLQKRLEEIVHGAPNDVAVKILK